MKMKGKSAKHYLVRWHEYAECVSLAAQSFKKSEELLDVTLSCDGKTIRAHKLVLAASSHYFRQILAVRICLVILKTNILTYKE